MIARRSRLVMGNLWGKANGPASSRISPTIFPSSGRFCRMAPILQLSAKSKQLLTVKSEENHIKTTISWFTNGQIADMIMG
ncbi:MAG: hypothetical protein LIO51_02050 [Clostridiales bacterium]|nr:hypothetical protein [Clostridiales bacterium]